MNRIPIHCKINGEHLELMVDPNQRALDVLRDQLRLTGTKEGCGVGECGACTILCGGLAVNSCLMPAVQMDREDIWTAEVLLSWKSDNNCREHSLKTVRCSAASARQVC